MPIIIFACYLVGVSTQDIKEKSVSRIWHLFAFLALMFSTNPKLFFLSVLWNLAIVVLCYWQYKKGAYGLADVFVLLNCSMFFAISRGSIRFLWEFCLFYFLAIILVYLHQYVNKNIKQYRFLRKVPYIPYLSCAFILTNMVV